MIELVAFSDFAYTFDFNPDTAPDSNPSHAFYSDPDLSLDSSLSRLLNVGLRPALHSDFGPTRRRRQSPGGAYVNAERAEGQPRGRCLCERRHGRGRPEPTAARRTSLHREEWKIYIKPSEKSTTHPGGGGRLRGPDVRSIQTSCCRPRPRTPHLHAAPAFITEQRAAVAAAAAARTAAPARAAPYHKTLLRCNFRFSFSLRASRKINMLKPDPPPDRRKKYSKLTKYLFYSSVFRAQRSIIWEGAEYTQLNEAGEAPSAADRATLAAIGSIPTQSLK
ncbi:hypothetical protein EVAR_101128_1 [Eumeta japonica]|uniref:Uncharacterized protein n=1 Tax=Eumeta variegata TaxID=151549 RepID=A0A4C2AGR6_EUMVA|nr:hypothetical protein EVAR_101128_1 [Eumeta japonica]